MADWKQITARIRRAKGSKDPVGQLSNLFQKTRDAMVAFELARYLETASKSEEAAKWYAISWQRFRRGDWKTKAQDALTRLGGVLPAAGEVLPVPEVPRAEMPASQPPAETAAPEFEASQSQSEPPLASESAPTETAPAPQAASQKQRSAGGVVDAEADAIVANQLSPAPELPALPTLILRLFNRLRLRRIRKLHLRGLWTRVRSLASLLRLPQNRQGAFPL